MNENCLKTKTIELILVELKLYKNTNYWLRIIQKQKLQEAPLPQRNSASAG